MSSLLSKGVNSTGSVFRNFLNSRTEKQIIAFFGVISFLIAMTTTGMFQEIPSHWVTNLEMGGLIASNVFFATAWKESSDSFLVKAVGFSYICFIGQWQVFAMYARRIDFKPLFPSDTHPAGLLIILVAVASFVFYCFIGEEE